MLVRGENMIVTYEMLKESLTDYRAKDNKIKRMADNKEIIKLTRNLYETNKNTPGYVVANAIYSLSYLSFDYALAYYRLIPEAVYTYTSATFGKGKKNCIKMILELIHTEMYLLIFILMVYKFFKNKIIHMSWQYPKKLYVINYTH